jgi:hypothetical protein
MPSYQCTACSLTFANPYQLKRHISDKHRNRVTTGSNDDDETSKMSYQEEPELWTDDDDVTSKMPYREESGLWTDDDNNDDKDKMVSKFIGY